MNAAHPLEVPAHDRPIPRRLAAARSAGSGARPIAVLLADGHGHTDPDPREELAGALVERGIEVDLIIAAPVRHPGDLPAGLDLIRLAHGTRRATLTDLNRYLRWRAPRWLLVDDEPGALLAFVARSLTASDVRIAVHGRCLEVMDGRPDGSAVSALARRLWHRADAVVASTRAQAETLAGHSHQHADRIRVLGGSAYEPRPTAPPDRTSATTLVIAGSLAGGEASPLESAVRELRRRRPVDVVFVDAGGDLRRYLGGPHVVLAISGGPATTPLLLEVVSSGGNLVVAGPLASDVDRLVAGSIRTVSLDDPPAALADRLEEAIDDPLHLDPGHVARWAASTTVDVYVDLFTAERA